MADPFVENVWMQYKNFGKAWVLPSERWLLESPPWLNTSSTHANKGLQRLQNGPVSPISANIACVESTERLSQCFSARPEYHWIAN